MENQIKGLIQRILERIEVLNEEGGKQESITECLLFIIELQKILLTEKAKPELEDFKPIPKAHTINAFCKGH